MDDCRCALLGVFRYVLMVRGLRCSGLLSWSSGRVGPCPRSGTLENEATARSGFGDGTRIHGVPGLELAGVILLDPGADCARKKARSL